MGGEGSGSLVELMKGQNDDDRRILKINFNKYLNNTTSMQGEQIFKNDSAAVTDMMGKEAGGINAGLLASLQNSSSIQKKLKAMFKKKRQPSIKDKLDQRMMVQNKEFREEENLINKILEKKPEFRNTTAKFLNQKI